MKRITVALVACMLYSMGAVAQEVIRDTIPIRQDGVGFHISTKRELPQHSSMQELPLEKSGINELGTKGASTEFPTSSCSRELTGVAPLPLWLSGSSISGFVVGIQHSLLFSNANTMRLAYQPINDLSFNVFTTIGNTSVPWSPFPTNQSSAYLGLNYRLTEIISLTAGVNVGSLMEERYFNAMSQISFNPNRHWHFTLYGGVFNSPMLHSGKSYNALYGGIKAKYTTDLGFYIYGEGAISKANMPYNGWSPNALFNGYSRIGGGVGYRNVGVGANYNTNPLTGRSRVTYEVSYDL